ncbi:bifunctional demethylmenaquinone methyltransferase/2-methoxy-6-polyprenyl-1,4-benzoquinol methylase UbiE [Chryseolinea sp. T2]|uniref:bifunctional demethylmenaquinone methyltransferase/2-methoxy-6-polyprenyl-1,4-benzoquinol methylase UbiE n=1 Tax=Chryseolinea sp. T2 TaxID=3129255 RepID=UPI003076C2D1
MAVVPYQQESGSKKEQVARMFNNISGRYDFLNHFLSLGIDRGWRRKAINILSPLKPQFILDVATGTGDFAVQATSLKPQKVVGVDISEGMLDVGKKKIDAKGLNNVVSLQYGDSESLPFGDNSFDAITVGFGVRNFEDLRQGLSEMYRVLKPGGKAVILEFSRPKSFPFKQVYNFYFSFILPRIGKMVSKDDSAYTYLPKSVEAFPDGEDFLRILQDVGFKQNQCRSLTFGVSSIYIGTK